MSLRLLQVVIPRRHRDELAALVASADAPDSWSIELSSEEQLTTFLVRAAAVEELSDKLTERFSSLEAYRLVILPVQASRPKVPEPEPEPEAGPGPGDRAPEDIAGKPRWQAVIGRVSREELDEAISRSGNTDALFMAMTFLATVVATAGLIKDSAAVIIGAMVIAPLLGPNMALALGTTLGDWKLIKRCVVTNAAGVTLAGGAAALTGLAVSPDPAIPEIAARTAADVGDITLALASGAAGALAFTAGVHGAVVGVMVAVALLPPTVVCGLMIGAGEWKPAAGAAMMLGVNVVSVNLAATLVFLIQGVRPDRWWREGDARRAVRLAIVMWGLLLAALAALLLTGGLDALPDDGPDDPHAPEAPMTHTSVP